MTYLSDSHISYRGRAAMATGAYPLKYWNKEYLVQQIIETKLHNPDPQINFDDLKSIPLHILSRYCLHKTEWHHVNHRPTWFYRCDKQSIVYMTQKDIREMKQLSECSNPESRKPVLARIKIDDWKISQSGHEFCAQRTITGVIYKGTIYSADGYSTTLSPEKHQVMKVYRKKTRNQKQVFDRIRRQMRKFQIYC